MINEAVQALALHINCAGRAYYEISSFASF